MNKRQKDVLKRIIVATVLLALLQLLKIENKYLAFGAYLIPYLVIGHDILKKAFKGIKNHQVFDENFLMAIATIGAFGLGEFTEGAAVMLFYQIGELFQSYAIGKSRRNISDLMDIRPDYANIEVDGNLEQVDPDEVEIGSIIVVNPGEKVPIDGIVVEGSSALNTSALTGESVPRKVNVGDEIISGCIAMNGVLKIETTKEFGESTVSKILDLVENASSKKSKSEAFISRFAHYYTPVVCYCALALALIPSIYLAIKGQFSWDWVYRALTFLVISCPCALVISIPLSFFAGIGAASSQGILVKGSNYLENFSKVKTIVMDKTGTITQGNFEVDEIYNVEIEKNELLEYAALAECHSSHPISKSILRAYGKNPELNRVSDIEEISGHGIKANVDGKTVLAGNSKLLKKFNIEFNECDSAATIVYLAIDNKYQGYITISDKLKENSIKAIKAMKASGITKIIMLTGDSEKVAKDIAQKAGIDEYHSELLPGDKVSIMEEILANKKGNEVVAFVGDGINDAPVLTRSDIGVAMGALGSDAAIEASDIVLMDDDILKISDAIRISKKCVGIVYQNIYFAIGVKVLCLLFTTFGYANMWIGIFADVGVMVIAVLNAIRNLAVAKK